MEIKDKDYFNLDHLIRIQFQKERISTRYTWKFEKKFLGIVIVKAGFRDGYGSIISDIEKYNTDLKQVGNVVYRKASVTLWYTNNHREYVYCDTNEEALEYVKTIQEISNCTFDSDLGIDTQTT